MPTSDRPLVLLTEPMHEAGVLLLRQHCEIMIAPDPTEPTILGLVGAAHAIVVRAKVTITAAIMDTAPGLKVIGRHGVGVDNVDVQAATERGIWVVNTPQANREAVAEHAVTLMLALAKHLRVADSSLRRGSWEARNQLRGVELVGRTLGVVGMGNIGSRVATICRHGFGMEIIYSDAIAREGAERDLAARRCDVRELFSKADFITLHLPGGPETRRLVGAELLALMKPTAYLINTSRGEVVDEGALLEALCKRRIAGAGLDVFAEEFGPEPLPLFALDNVIVTPHMAAHTEEAMRRMSLVAEDVLRVLTGERPCWPVNEVS